MLVQTNKMDQQAAAWQLMPPLLRKHYSYRAGLDWFRVEQKQWYELSAVERLHFLDAIRDNPTFGPEFDLVPDGGVYSNGVTVADAYANITGMRIDPTFRPAERQALITRTPVMKPEAKVINFADYRKSHSLENLRRNPRNPENG